MKQLLEILELPPPLWVVLLIALLNVVSRVLVISWIFRRAYGSAAKANDALTRAIRRWLEVPKIVSMLKSALETLGGIEEVELSEGGILLTHED